jgi:hypothetical protein
MEAVLRFRSDALPGVELLMLLLLRGLPGVSAPSAGKRFEPATGGTMPAQEVAGLSGR